MDHIKLSAEKRTITGKAVARLRRDGIIPIVVYGGNVEGALTLQVNERELQRVLHRAGTGTVIDLEVEETSYPVLARSVDRHPTRHDIRHADFLAVRLDQPIEAQVRLILVGGSTLVDNNEAILMQSQDTVTVRALPDQLPQNLELDISSLEEIGQQLTLGDVPVADGVTLVGDKEAVVAALAAPTRPVEEEVVEEGEEGLDEIEYGEVGTDAEEASEEDSDES